MGKEIDMRTVIAIAAVVVLVLGIVVWRTFARPTTQVSTAQEQAQTAETMRQGYEQEMRRGAMPVPGGMPQPGGR